jgi:hypothetical protein
MVGGNFLLVVRVFVVALGKRIFLGLWENVVALWLGMRFYLNDKIKSKYIIHRCCIAGRKIL